MFRIFVVEDDPRVSDTLKGLLTAIPDVRIAECAATETAAVNWLAEHQGGWNLAIVDIALAQGSGMRVLSAFRVRHPQQKLVVLGNQVGKDMRRRCRLLGADAAFDKSTELEDLIDYCRRMAEIAAAGRDIDFLKL